jgi:hypothetical protein
MTGLYPKASLNGHALLGPLLRLRVVSLLRLRVVSLLRLQVARDMLQVAVYHVARPRDMTGLHPNLSLNGHMILQVARDMAGPHPAL